MIEKKIVEEINSRFDLILVASKYARSIQQKENSIQLSSCKHKCTVIALQELEKSMMNIDK